MGIVVVLGIGALLILRSQAVEIVHAVVENAVIQKAPEGYPTDRIHEAFESSLRTAQREGTTQQYLEELKVLSHRIEKVQRLEKIEVDELIIDLKR
jgi:hypothetical protein